MIFTPSLVKICQILGTILISVVKSEDRRTDRQTTAMSLDSITKEFLYNPQNSQLRDAKTIYILI